MFTGRGKGALGSTDEKRGEGAQEGSSQEKELWCGRASEGSEGPTPRISFVAAARGSPKLQRAASRTGPCQGRGDSALSSHSKIPTSQGSAWRPPKARSHRVGCSGSVAGPEGRQGDRGGWAGPHSASGSPRADPRGSLKLANGGVPSSAWEPRAGGDKRGSGWGRRATQTPAPAPVGREPPLPGRRWKETPGPGKAGGVRERRGVGTRLPGAHPPAAKLSSRPGGEQRWARAPEPTSPGRGRGGRATERALRRGRAPDAPRSTRRVQGSRGTNTRSPRPVPPTGSRGPYRSGRRRERRPKVSWLTWPRERNVHGSAALAAGPAATPRRRRRRRRLLVAPHAGPPRLVAASLPLQPDTRSPLHPLGPDPPPRAPRSPPRLRRPPRPPAAAVPPGPCTCLALPCRTAGLPDSLTSGPRGAGCGRRDPLAREPPPGPARVRAHSHTRSPPRLAPEKASPAPAEAPPRTPPAPATQAGGHPTPTRHPGSPTPSDLPQSRPPLPGKLRLGLALRLPCGHLPSPRVPLAPATPLPALPRNLPRPASSQNCCRDPSLSHHAPKHGS